jgi:predicted nuclease with TOPRIM domain
MNRKERAIVEVFEQMLDTIYEARNEAIKSSKEEVSRVEERLDRIEKENDKRWEMLKDYLGVEVTEEAKIEVDTSGFSSSCGRLFGIEVFSSDELPTKAVKVRKLKKSVKKK